MLRASDRQSLIYFVLFCSDNYDILPEEQYCEHHHEDIGEDVVSLILQFYGQHSIPPEPRVVIAFRCVDPW